MSDPVEGFRDWGARLSNWGRWGAGDGRGTLNWITPERVAAAARLIQVGEVVSLGLPLDADGPQPSDGVRPNPVHVMTRTPDVEPEPGGFQWMDDMLTMAPQSATQLDALSHVAYDGFLYNGVPVDSIGPGGASVHGVEALREGVHGRGLLVDLPRHLGVDRLSADHAVTVEELDDCLARQGLEPSQGDTLLVRTGWLRTLRDQGRSAYMSREPGLSLPVTAWLSEHRIAFVASDNWGLEIAPSQSPESMPVHCVLVRDMGMAIGEMFDLEGLADACSRHQRWEFFFSAHPLQITGGTGSPLEPKAIF
ncbi:cyclase family protein [Aeromicrobium endophyticum]|uniref:Cyclase family protein n=1 Tax=Aeromicrobium endophyticum TaxID=2292704 RepID=A0A371P4S1_9ACTN|nr:cyclase family protein [Aeromicrobium endophyticum]REK70922.1 cyclase family protein [Aeromicrobium endophyticum]